MAEQIKKSLKQQQQENNIEFEGPGAIVHATSNQDNKGVLQDIIRQKIDKSKNSDSKSDEQQTTTTVDIVDPQKKTKNRT